MLVIKLVTKTMLCIQDSHLCTYMDLFASLLEKSSEIYHPPLLIGARIHATTNGALTQFSTTL